MPPAPTFRIGGISVRRGQTKDIRLEVSERYTGDPIRLPIRVVRGKRSGPTIFVTAAIHGDEFNGIGIIHDLMYGDPLTLLKGDLILVPIVNIFGFETQDRYMPDRRDLNRCFPGSSGGSLSSRVAHALFCEVVEKCDFGIDIHSAAAPRTNYPNVRGDLSVAGVRRLAKVFGSELIINAKGPEGSLRRTATKAGCPTVILEAGEPRKIEPRILELGIRGVQDVLKHLGMLAGEPTQPPFQVRVHKATWVRAEVGGILRFHVSPGEHVKAEQPIATNVSIFGHDQNLLTSPVDGIVLGMTTLPAVKPGEPVCHIAIPNRSLRTVKKALAAGPSDSLHRRLRRDLATNISVTEREGEWPGADETIHDDSS